MTLKNCKDVQPQFQKAIANKNEILLLIFWTKTLVMHTIDKGRGKRHFRNVIGELVPLPWKTV